MELQQSPLYVQYIKTIRWHVLTIDHTHIFIRNIPLSGTIAKIQRPTKLPSVKKLVPLLKKYRVRSVVAEAARDQDPQEFSDWCKTVQQHFKLISSPYLPTKTILIDLKPNEEEIFHSFSEAKRRAVRRAQKNNVMIKESTNIDDLIKIKNKSAGFLGFLTTFGMKKLWPIFGPNHAAILLACSSSEKSVGGVLLLFWNRIAYYWIAGATHEGKKLFAPTLLVWEALKLAKIRGAKQFDFVGVWDERLPRQYDSWKGFTKFKEGFGGKTLYYPTAMPHR
ncbi:peptidoglycan bridge formation glycyltransferase FemA/FemB family protein [Candidatus Gottesmanbacteria bacterium]|nr:peptidoglycan bridge formation glycyltransferase FemA/FemB family protein [Candidatus Gottesmanbacteria bacterium]